MTERCVCHRQSNLQLIANNNVPKRGRSSFKAHSFGVGPSTARCHRREHALVLQAANQPFLLGDLREGAISQGRGMFSQPPTSEVQFTPQSPYNRPTSRRFTLPTAEGSHVAAGNHLSNASRTDQTRDWPNQVRVSCIKNARQKALSPLTRRGLSATALME